MSVSAIPKDEVAAQRERECERDVSLQNYHDARAEALAAFERRYLEQLMTIACGNVTRAAHLAGKERRALGKLLKKHGIARADFDAEPPS